ncbi:MAG: hypothetical protein MIO92_05130 [Methanosarcinaceae archaeon]|nr:hypothetical protein [Methanosarcinaceae archaeon]
MEYGKNTSKYFEMLFSLAREITKPELKEGNEELQSVIKNTILGIEGPRTVERNVSPREYFIANKLYRPMSEIMTSVETIENIAIYARSFPYKRQGVSRITYLKYHVENYLNELYLLKNRLIAYLKVIERSYSKSDISEHVAKTISLQYKVVSKVLKGYIEIRGTHVHKHRYSDDDFDRLSMLELLSRSNSDDSFEKIMNFLSNKAYSEIKKKWVDKIKSDIKGIYSLLETYFEAVLLAISEDGNVILFREIAIV